MKITAFGILSILLFCTSGYAQNPVPNPSLEQWTGHQPNDWFTSNLPDNAGDNVLPSQPGFSGDFALKGTVIEAPGAPGMVLLPLLESNTSDFGFPVSKTYAYLSLFYRFQPAHPADKLVVSVGVQDDQGSVIGGGFREITAAADSFTLLNLPLSYAPGRPYRAVISVTIDTNNPEGMPSIGSSFEVDDISLNQGLLQKMTGFMVMGDEVSDFIECSETWFKYWMQDETGSLDSLYHTIATDPYEPVFAQILAIKRPPPDRGYASERDGLLLIQKILKLEKRTEENECPEK